MTKEQILVEMKELMTVLHKRADEFREKPELLIEWVRKSGEIDLRVKLLNSCDLLWLQDTYKAWYKKELLPVAKQYLKDNAPNIPDISTLEI